MKITGVLAGLTAVCAVCLAGCTGKSYVVLLDNPDGTAGKVVVQGKQGEQIIDKAGEGAPLDGSAPPAPVDQQQIAHDFSAAMKARPALPQQFLLYFETGGSEPTPESAIELDKIIAVVNQRPAADVSVIGHTDTLGNAAVNEKLARARASIVADLLKQKGMKAHALTVESHGESNLLIQTPDETAEPRNRRVEVSVR